MKPLKNFALALTVFSLVLGTMLFVVPEEAWAVECMASCQTGFDCNCTWSFVDCCWKLDGFGCQSYDCSSGQLAITCYCP